MTALAVASRLTSMVSGWAVFGKASIDERPPADCTLVVQPNGSWCADLSTFTLAGDVDLMFTSNEGGQFCGPATVARSRADTDPIRTVTELVGTGPLLIARTGDAELGAGPDADILDGEVVA